jgi:hypothetical protein
MRELLSELWATLIKALGLVSKSVDALEVGVDAVADVMHIAKDTTSQIRAEMAIENANALALLKATPKASRPK